MAMIALCSVNGAAGVTTSAVALTTVWPGPVLLVEADPLGGAVVPGYFEGMLSPPNDLLGLVNLARHGARPEQLWAMSLAMDPVGRRLLVPGMTDPLVQAKVAATAWPQVAGLLSAVRDRDVLVDCGRISHPYAPRPLLAAAAVIAVVTGSALPDLYALQRHLPAVREAAGQRSLVRLLVVENARRHGAAAVAAAAGIDAVGLPFDPRSAAVFSQGRSPLPGRRHNAYLHKISRLAPALRDLLAASAGAEKVA